MYCTTNNNNCLNSKQTKPYYEILVLREKSKVNYCTNSCKDRSLKEFLKADIENNLYLERNYEECPICSMYDAFMIELSCHHKICNQCINKVFDTANKCPTCRTLIIMKSENDKISEFYKENLTTEHSYLIDTVYKLVNSIDYEFDLELLESSYFARTNRDVKNDLTLIRDYINLFKI